MDTTVLYQLTYGLYIVGAFKDGRPTGCVINTCFQVTSENPRLVISLNKNNFTLEAIREFRRFSLSILAEDSDPALITSFGFRSSRDSDKYEGFGYDVVAGTPCVRGQFAGRLVMEAQEFVDCGTHVLVIGQLVDTRKGDGTPMTYTYYHNVIKGKAPKNAPTYRAEEEAKTDGRAGDIASGAAKRKYRCDICGYIAETDGELPADYRCPLCNADVTHFHPVE